MAKFNRVHLANGDHVGRGKVANEFDVAQAKAKYLANFIEGGGVCG